MQVESHYLTDISGTALFYPCCGRDLELPLRLFASVISNFYFVDIRRPPRPQLVDIANPAPRSYLRSGGEAFLHLSVHNEFRIHRWKSRGEEALSEIPKLGVFFHRGDTLANGEGSSGVPWLGRALFSIVLAKLVPGGLVVTDGSNRGRDGPRQLAQFHRNAQIKGGAVDAAFPFYYQDRRFTCLAYVGEKYGPTLIWRVA